MTRLPASQASQTWVPVCSIDLKTPKYGEKLEKQVCMPCFAGPVEQFQMKAVEVQFNQPAVVGFRNRTTHHLPTATDGSLHGE